MLIHYVPYTRNKYKIYIKLCMNLYFDYFVVIFKGNCELFFCKSIDVYIGTFVGITRNETNFETSGNSRVFPGRIFNRVF